MLCGFGRSGLAYVETDPIEADATIIVRALLRGLYDRPLRVSPSPPKSARSPNLKTASCAC